MKGFSAFSVALAAVVSAAGCDSSSLIPSKASSVTVETPSAATSSAAVPAGGAAETTIRISIAAGVVTPANAEAQAVAGELIALEVSSDAPDSIHVHSVPPHVFDVAARPGQRFEFTVDVPGRVDVELHELNRTILTLMVRPG